MLSRCFHFGFFEIFVSSLFLMVFLDFCTYWLSVLYNLKADSQEEYHDVNPKIRYKALQRPSCAYTFSHYELSDKLRLKHPLQPWTSSVPTMRLEAIRSIIPIRFKNCLPKNANGWPNRCRCISLRLIPCLSMNRIKFVNDTRNMMAAISVTMPSGSFGSSSSLVSSFSAWLCS